MNDSVIEHADAFDWLAAQEPGAATAIVYDPPYAVGTPVRGREDGAAGSVFGPLSFLSRTMSLCTQALRPGGIVDYPARRTHLYEKPAAVYEHILARICRAGDLVLDPFAGSGSSRDAAEKLGLQWRGCDIDPAFAVTTSS